MIYFLGVYLLQVHVRAQTVVRFSTRHRVTPCYEL